MGSFSFIRKGSTTFSRTDLVSFSASSPYKVTSWAPVVVGSTKTNESGAAAINSAFNGGNCANAYIGGNFTTVNGTTVTNIAEISTSTGNVVTGFAHNANGAVDTLAAVGGQGAYFGGHERWASNPNACDTLGAGGYVAPGMAGFNPANGAPFVNSANSAGYYSRARAWAPTT